MQNLGRSYRRFLVFTFITCISGSPASAQETIKLALIEPMSGPFAAVGTHALHQFQYIAERINADGGVGGRTLEILSYDNKLSVQETVVSAQKAVDAGARYVLVGNGSGPGGAIQDFVTRYNERNPGKEVMYLNYSAEDPVLTNERCSYWQFRWVPHTTMKMKALTSFIAKQPEIKKVYLINQDYSLGQNSRESARLFLKDMRPDISIVGDELHPLAKINDFAPYVAKIRASGADSVITANWGPDFALLLKASGEAGLKVRWFTFFGAGPGGPTAIKQAGLSGQVSAIVEGYSNQPGADDADFETDFRRRYAGYGWWYPRARNTIDMMVAAMRQGGSTEPSKIAPLLEGMNFKGAYGPVLMRGEDHQGFNDMYVVSLVPLKDGMKFDEESTGLGWQAVAPVPLSETVVDTTCKMKRPS
ncbi:MULTISPECIES: branched-chain amino acid ABC transporter substrate-binding protein [unclassified Bradyrhizobium]|uniref:branched-chain amino acid ABC transporter substrate-binding protein n=1 Tax=unclassified Bradyrhizobium TaxID=2631580 RepID=UPI001FEFE07F|nr:MULTISPECIES: branched-chain amino acid ABC transporter substrate-binding protein [unclassified Bradyrhizobium]